MNDRIEVGIWCGAMKLVPKVFVWKGREYEVKRITMDIWRQDSGRKYRCFIVETNGMMAELVWDIQDWNWQIRNAQSIS